MGILWLRGRIDQFADLSKNPPADAFKRVLGIAPPAGVSEIMLAGYAPFNGDGIMTFRAVDVDAVLSSIKHGPLGLQGPLKDDNDIYTSVDWRSRDPEFRQWLRVVAWERIKHIAKPEYYKFGGTSGWAGPLAVDRRRKLFFVYGQIY